MTGIVIDLDPRPSRFPYNTVGMWNFFPSANESGLYPSGEEKGKNISIAVKQTGNDDYSFLIAIHELIEAYLCLKRGISEEEVTAYDKLFELMRKNQPDLIGDQESGDMVSAPYHKEHVFATKIERLLAAELGVNWDEYCEAINKL